MPGLIEHFQHKLAPPGHSGGVSCDADWPAIGPIRLLTESSAGFQPKPVEELNASLGWALGHPTNCSNLLPGLNAIAKALNGGEIARAMIATQFLRLPALDERQSHQAARAVAMLKAAVDDPKHPGWPAKTPGGRGGQFRPKDASFEDFEELQIPQLPDARQQLLSEMDRKITRAAIRAVLRRLLTYKRVTRFLGEAASNVVPGLDAIGDAAMVYDVAEMAGEMVELRRLSVVARAWAQQAPYSLSELRASSKSLSFSSFEEFKKTEVQKYFPNAGDGYEYHHIIPQASGVSNSILNSTDNIIRLPKLVHQIVSTEWTELAHESGTSLREYLKQMPLAEQRRIGLKILRDLGILK